MRRVRPSAWTALMLCLALLVVPTDGAQAQPVLPQLHIDASESGRVVFDGLIDSLDKDPRLGAVLDLRYTTSLGGLRELCEGGDSTGPSIVLTIARLRPSLAAECAQNGVTDTITLELGRGAIILAVRAGSNLTALTSDQVYLALARDVPDKDEFRRNMFIRWSDIDRSLPNDDIRFQLPTRGDGNRAMFDSMILQGGCRDEKLVQQIFSAQHRTARCVTTRVDRVRDIPHGQAVRALLDAPEGTIGVLTYLDILESNGQLVGLALDGIEPSHDNILAGIYPYSTSYWLYGKPASATSKAGLASAAATHRIMEHAASEAMIGPNGTLTNLGLVPLPEGDRAVQRAELNAEPRPLDSITSTIGWTASAIASAVTQTWNLMGFGETQGDGQDSQIPVNFSKLMDIAGYKAKEFESTFGIIPGAMMNFGMVREMSDADEEYLDLVLYHDAHRRHGMLSAIQRRIVRAILNINERGGYQVTNVEITLLPLPQVRLVVTPSDGAMSMEATWLARAIEQLGDRLTENGR